MRRGGDCGAGTGVYRVLKPRYSKTGETTQTPDGLIKWYRVDWVDLGVANSYEEARAKFGGRPVLERIGRLH